MSGAITAAVITVGGGLVMANQQRQAAKGAMNAQTAAAQAGIDAQNAQYQNMVKLMQPWVQSGAGALGGQNALLGLNGPQAQQQAIQQLQNSPQFQALSKQGETGILSNASATGGLRGGNTQASLAQFRPMLLSQLIDQQYARLGQVSAMGQAGAASQAAAGMQLGQNTAGLLGQIGQFQAGGALANGVSNAGELNGLLQGLGMFGRSKGWKGFGGAGFGGLEAVTKDGR